MLTMAAFIWSKIKQKKKRVISWNVLKSVKTVILSHNYVYVYVESDRKVLDGERTDRQKTHKIGIVLVSPQAQLRYMLAH